MQTKLLLLYKVAYKNYLNTDVIKYIWKIVQQDSANIIINKWYNYIKYCNIDIVYYIEMYNINILNNKKKERILSIIMSNLNINIANRNISSSIWWVKNLLKLKKNVEKKEDKKRIDNLIDKIKKIK